MKKVEFMKIKKINIPENTILIIDKPKTLISFKSM